MENYIIKDKNGHIVSAELVIAFFSDETKKNYVALNNHDSVFSENSSYNNLDVFEIIKEENNVFYVSNISDNEWEIVKDTLIKKILSKIQ